jgi:integrase
MQAGRWVEEDAPTVPTLGAAIQQYRERVAVKLKGAQVYSYSFKEVEASELGAKRVDRVKPGDLADWRDSLLGRGLKNATVARRLGMLSGVLSWCQKERGWLKENPMLSVRKPVVRDARTRTLDDDEVRYLEIATRSARARWLPDAVTMLMRTAMRRSELVALRCVDVDLPQSVARLRDSKNGDARDVPLCPEAKAALARLLEAAKASKMPQAGVLPINDAEAISFAFRRAVVRAQERYVEDCAVEGRVALSGFLQGVRLHDLRHHAISAWARTGALSVIDLMKISGHRSPRMLARETLINRPVLA